MDLKNYTFFSQCIQIGIVFRRLRFKPQIAAVSGCIFHCFTKWRGLGPEGWGPGEEGSPVAASESYRGRCSHTRQLYLHNCNGNPHPASPLPTYIYMYVCSKSASSLSFSQRRRGAWQPHSAPESVAGESSGNGYRIYIPHKYTHISQATLPCLITELGFKSFSRPLQSFKP